MNKKDVMELKRRFTKEGCTITKMRGCYVNSSKEKLVTFTEDFLRLEEEEFYKYLDIAKKSISGTLGNNLVELSFPDEDSLQDIFLELKNSKLEDDTIAESFFDHIIDSYDEVGNYLILLFYDAYDVPMKTLDDMLLDDSEEVYDYVLCAICPVNLSKPGLGYKENENRIGVLLRDWVVSPTESGFLFPAFTDRSSDIHHIMAYSKNPKKPHKEFWENGLGCPSLLTSAEKKMAFSDLITKSFGPDNEDLGDIITDVQENIKDFITSSETTRDKNEPLFITPQDVEEILIDSSINEQKAARMKEQYEETFGDEIPLAEELYDPKAVKDQELRNEKKELKRQVVDLTHQLEDAGVISPDGEDIDVFIRVSEETAQRISPAFVDGERCLVIPLSDIHTASINGEKQNL